MTVTDNSSTSVDLHFVTALSTKWVLIRGSYVCVSAVKKTKNSENRKGKKKTANHTKA